MINEMKKYSDAIDKISISSGKIISWLTIFMVITTFAIVVLRYVFGWGFIWLQEILVWMHAAVFMLGATYTLQQEEHVRVDIFYRDLDAKKRAWINIFGVALFLLPLCFLFFLEAWNYVTSAWLLKEISRNTGGLPYPAIPVLKSMLLLMPIGLMIQGISLFLKSLIAIRQN